MDHLKVTKSAVADLDEDVDSWDEDVNRADYELENLRDALRLGSHERVDSHARVTCLFAHQDVGIDQIGIGFDEEFYGRIGSVISELTGKVEGVR